MAKIIIPKNEIPSFSDEQTNRFRFRVVNKNRNLNSEWSVIGEIKRQIGDIDYTLPSSFGVNSINAGLIVSWQTINNINQLYDVHMKQYSRIYESAGGGYYTYFSEDSMLSESTSKNTATIHLINTGGLIFTGGGGQNGSQAIVYNFSYPRKELTKWNVLGCERVSNVLKIYIQSGVTDFDKINNSNNYVYVDMTINPQYGQQYLSLEDMKVFNRVTFMTNINKTNPSYTILEKSDNGPNISYFKPDSGYVRRLDPDPLFISDYKNYLFA